MNKDSRVPWTGKMPTGWKTCKYKYFTSNGMGETILREELKDEGIPVYSATQDDVCFGFVENSRVILHKGDFIIPARGNSIGCISLVKEEVATCTQTTIYSKLIGLPIVNKYLFYCALGLKDVWFKFDQTAIPQITVSQVDSNIVPLPESEIKQQAIADYLDKECARIDDIVEKQRNIIEKLKKYKKSVITETVTKGLNPTAAMKDSGIEWIGEIPEHYKLSKLKYYARYITDGTHSTPEYVAEGTPFLSIKDISSGKLDFSDTKYISLEQHQELSRHAPIEKGDILFTRIGTLGVSVIVDVDIVFDIFVSVGLLKPKDNINIKYLNYVMNSEYYYQYIQLVKAGGGTSAAKFNLFDVSNSPIIYPPLQEQQIIADYLDQKCAEIDSVIEKREKMVDLLTEYKKSLIYECVTGKKEVA